MTDRTLTDADVDAIAAALETRLSARLVTQAGRGVLKLAWRGIVLLIVWLAVYGLTSHLIRH